MTGAEVEPSSVIEGGFGRRAALHEVEPLTLDRIRAHLPSSRLRFGSFALGADDADAIWELERRR